MWREAAESISLFNSNLIPKRYQSGDDCLNSKFGPADGRNLRFSRGHPTQSLLEGVEGRAGLTGDTLPDVTNPHRPA